MGIIRNARRLLAATVLAAFTVCAGAADTGLDVDGDGQQDALTDGMLVLRYLFGYRGETLVEGAVAEGCSRCDTQAIVAFLDQWSKGGGSCGYLPDLMISGVTGPGTAEVGNQVTLAAEVVNRGECKAPPFSVSFRLAADEAGEHSVPLPGVACEMPDGLSVSESIQCQALWTVPVASVEGDFWLMAVADSGFDVTESNESNNTGVDGNPVNIVDSRLPDLVVNSISGPDTGTPGGSIDISVQIANQGPAAAGAFRVGFYFSADQTITTDDAKSPGYCNYQNGLAPGYTSSCEGPISVPESLEPGARLFLGAYIDDDLQIAESDEDNNARSAQHAINMTGTEPDSWTITGYVKRGAYNYFVEENIQIQLRPDGTWTGVSDMRHVTTSGSGGAEYPLSGTYGLSGSFAAPQAVWDEPAGGNSPRFALDFKNGSAVQGVWDASDGIGFYFWDVDLDCRYTVVEGQSESADDCTFTLH